MTREQYLAARKVLMDAAQAFLNEAKMEEFANKTKEVEDLDNQYERISAAQANLNALNGRALAPNLENFAVNSAVAGNIVDAFGQSAENDIYDSAEYKNAFKNLVMFNTAMPNKFVNADANTKTSDVGSVIPTTTMQKIIEKMEAIGMILPLVTHTSYKGGVSIPTSTVKPVATWASEGAGSDKQKKTTGSITFSYYKLRCAISMSLETTVVTYPVFEEQFSQNVAEAMVKAKEQAIISGDGTGKPKGILAETPASGQALEITEGNNITYADIVAMEAALPQAYENGAAWSMTKKTYLSQIVGMVDDNGQPVARTNFGISGKPEYSILGRPVKLVGDYMSNFAKTVSADTIVAFIFNFKDYVMNENMVTTVKRYTDEDTDDEIMKAITLVDGKVVDKNSLVTLTVKNS